MNGATDEEIDIIFSNLDMAGTGHIEFSEFVAGGCDKSTLFTEDKLKIAFNTFDKSKKGFINKQDIVDFLSKSDDRLGQKLCMDHSVVI
jgi:Ca2+-binding EF-hand superfamily protein